MRGCARSLIGSAKNKLLRSDAGKRNLPRSAGGKGRRKGVRTLYRIRLLSDFFLEIKGKKQTAPVRSSGAAFYTMFFSTSNNCIYLKSTVVSIIFVISNDIYSIIGD